MQRRSCLATWVKLLLPAVAAIPLFTSAHAADFDERITAPRMSVSAWKVQAQRFIIQYRENADSVNDPLQLLDEGSFKTWFQLDWMLSNAMDERVSFGDMSSLGLQRSTSGNAYTAIRQESPQWMPPDILLQVMQETYGGFDLHVVQLKRRGFRDEDVAILKNYLASTRWERTALSENTQLIESFATRAVQADRGLRPKTTREEMMSFLYQRDLNEANARRQWAVTLLQSFDKQRQRVLLSYLGEMEAKRTYAGLGDAATRQAAMDQLLASLVSGEFRNMLKKAEEELAK